uniref:Diamine acetyltransferase 1 n=1 Tax=Myotis myotis TaxID=51298 RepID=A0A7J7YGK5_MYOMY|nr:spermidine/spermine N1-acetyltransferase 1 [Myotis myotis]
MKAFSLIHACIFLKPMVGFGFCNYNFYESILSIAHNDTLITGHSVVGFAMYYFTYDPWIGKLLYLEDFFVMSDFRGFGIGSEILKNLSQVAMKCRCSSMHFLVAEWNKPSINFYKKRGASDLSSEEGWRLFKIDKEYLLKMAAEE